MLTCGKCQCEVKREWKCQCNQFLTQNDVKMRDLQPFISKLNGWGNFLNFVKMSSHELENPTPREIKIELPEDFEPNLEAALKSHILRVLHLHEGNKSHAAQALGISVKTIYNKLEMWGMHFPETVRTEQ